MTEHTITRNEAEIKLLRRALDARWRHLDSAARKADCPPGNVASLKHEARAVYELDVAIREETGVYLPGEWKPVERMSVDEAYDEALSLEDYFDRCAEIGQGINTKESVRYRLCREKVQTAIDADETTIWLDEDWNTRQCRIEARRGF